jgi:hypothetical protein
MRTKQEKKATKPMGKGKPAPPRRTFPELTAQGKPRGNSDYPFYALNEENQHLHTLAIYVRGFDELKELWEASFGDDSGDELAFLKSDGKFDFMAQSMILRNLVGQMVKGEFGAIQRFAEAYATYEEGWVKLPNKDMAKLCLMTACHALWREKQKRHGVLKGLLKNRACDIWAGFRCRLKKKPPSVQNLKNERAGLPHVDWPLIFRELALSDLPESKAGRKPKIGNCIC